MAGSLRRDAHQPRSDSGPRLYALRPQAPRLWLTVIGLGLVMVLFLLVFGLSAVTSISIWPLGIAELNSGTGTTSAGDMVRFEAAMTVMALSGFGLALGAVGLSRQWTPAETVKTMLSDRPPLAVVLGAFGLFLLAGLASGSAATSIGELVGHLPQREEMTGSGVLVVVAQWVSLVSAAFMEEPVIVGAPVLLLVVFGRGAVGAAILTSMLLRWVIHFYYGPGSVAYLVWALVAVVLYLYGRTLIPLIAAHLWWNIGVGLQMFGFVTSVQLQLVTVAAGFLAFSFACANLDAVSAWVGKNPWSDRLLRPVVAPRRDGAGIVPPSIRRRRAVGWKALLLGGADALAAIAGVALGVITGLEKFDRLHAVVFIAILLGSLLALWMYSMWKKPWLIAVTLVANFTYYSAALGSNAVVWFGDAPESGDTELLLWLHIIVGLGMVVLLSWVKRGSELLPDSASDTATSGAEAN